MSAPAPPIATGPTAPADSRLDGRPATPRRRGVRRAISTAIRLVITAAGIAVALTIDLQVVVLVPVLFMLVVPFERLYPRQADQPTRRPMLATDIGFALLGPLLNGIGVVVSVAVAAVSLVWVPALLLRPLVASIPPAAAPLVAFAMLDLLIYWAHRWAHEVPTLWRFHSVHHSSEHMDWVSGFRTHPFDGLIIAPAVGFLVVAGFDAEVAGVLGVAQLTLGLFFHANVRVRWRWLDRIICNPEFHHWHHANESDAIGHNYGAALPWWDLIFGTFFMPRGDRRPQHYGVDEPMPRTILGLLAHPVRLRRPSPRRLRRALGRIAGEIWASTRRPTHSVRRQSVPGSTTTNASLFSPGQLPGHDPVG